MPVYHEIPAAMINAQFPRVAFKASHNSYDIFNVTLAQQITWRRAAASEGGCRGIELDIAQSPDTTHSWQWSINHTDQYDPDPAKQLSTWLADVVKWSQKLGGKHGPMLIHLDLKSAHGNDADFPAQIDAYLTRALAGTSFYRADGLLDGKPSLLEGARANGWPTLGQLTGKIIICLTGTITARTDAYIASLITTRSGICFCDREITDELSAGTPIAAADFPNRLILNFDTRTAVCALPDPAQIGECEQLLLRAYALPIVGWQDALNAGANILAVDVPLIGSENVNPPLYAKAKGR